MFQYCIQAFFLAVKRSCAKNGFKHFLRACSMFDHCTFRCQVSTKDCNTSICSDCFIIWTDNIFFCKIYIVSFVKFLKPLLTFLIESVVLQLFKVFTQSLACNCHDIQMEMLFDLFHDCRYTACIVETFCRPASCRTNIQKISCISVESVEGVSCDLNAKFMSNCRKMKQTVCTSGDCCMYKDCILKAVHCYNIRRTHIFHLCDSYSLSSCFSCKSQKIRTCGWHQCCTRKCKSQCFCHDLHCRCCSDKRACTTAWAGITFCPVKLLFVNFATFKFSAVHSKLFQSQHFRSCIHSSARYKYRRNINSCKSHQISGYTLITAGEINSCIKWCCICMNFNHVCDHFTAGKTIINSICTLAFSVTDICAVITGTKSAFLSNSLADLFHKNVQMSTSWMAVSVCTLYHNLYFSQVFFLPSCTNTQRIKLRCKFSHFLTF